MRDPARPKRRLAQANTRHPTTKRAKIKNVSKASSVQVVYSTTGSNLKMAAIRIVADGRPVKVDAALTL